MSFRLKLALSYFLLLFGVLIVGITAWQMASQLNTTIDHTLQLHQPRMEAAEKLEINLNSVGFDLLSYLHKHDPQHLQRIKMDETAFRQSLHDYKQLAESDNERQFSMRLQAAFKRFTKLTSMLISNTDHQSTTFKQLEIELTEIDHLLDEKIQPPTVSDTPDKRTITYELEININGMMKWLARFLATHDADDLAALHEDHREIESFIQHYRGMHLSGMEAVNIHLFQQLFQRISKLTDNLIKLEQQQQQQLIELKNQRSRMYDLLHNKVQLQAAQLLQQASQQTIYRANRTLRITAGVLVTVMLSGLLFVILLTRRFNRAVDRLMSAAAAMSEGAYDHPIAISNHDEFGRLANSFNSMAQAVQERQQEVERIIQSMLDGMITIDVHGRIQRFNQAAEQIFGYHSEEMIGQNVSMLMPEPDQSGHDGYIHNYLTGGEAKIIGIGREVQGLRKDGSLFDMDLSITEIEFNGQRSFIGTVRDISRRKQDETTIQETTMRLERQHEVYTRLSHLIGARGLALADAIHMITEDATQALAIGRASIWQLRNNGRELCCLDLYEAKKQSHSADMILNIDDYPVYFNTLKQKHVIDADNACSDYRTVEFANTYLHPLGIGAMLDVPVQHEGEVVGVLCLEHQGGERKWQADEQQFGRAIASLITLLLEIDQRKHIEQKIHEKNIELNRANRMKSEFLANMSHELRTPLNAIIGFSAVMQDGLAGDMNAEQLEYTGDIHASGEHLLALINDILDLSKIEAGKMELHPSEVLLHEMAHSCLTIVREKAANHGITLSLDMKHAPDTALLDEQKCKQILFNLLSNAVKFSDRGGSVTLGMHKVHRDAVSANIASDAEQWLAISVKDQGIGIRNEDFERLFQSFQQLENPLTKSHEGTGLGLALVKRLAELHGGGVDVSSNFGKGSCFTIWLPIQPDNNLSAAPVMPVMAGKDSLSRMDTIANASAPTILVIEDDVQAASLLLLQLEQEGYRCDCVHSAEDALQWLQRQKPDIITLDILLPGMDGWQFLEQIREDKRYRDIPVVIVSVVAEEEHGYALGASQVLSKPVSKASLLHSIALMGFGETGKHLTVMAVDDDEKALRMIERYLQAEGFSVVKAHGGEEAIRMAAEVSPNLLLLDLMMPDISGFDVVEALKQNSQTASIPIIILTAKDITDEDRHRLNSDIVKIMRKKSLEQAHFLDEINRVNRSRFANGSKQQTPISGTNEHPYLLIVEDNMETARVMQVMLQSHGYEVGYTGNGKIALEMLQARRPDLLLLDLMMPEMDGFTLIDRLQTMDEMRDIPLLIVSCYDEMPDQIACFSANAFLSKPFNRDALLDITARMISDEHSAKTVLIIDDDPQAIKLVSGYMTGSDYHLLSASGGHDGLIMAKQHQPDLILLDLMMPDMSGFEVIGQLKSGSSTSAIPVIVMTSKQLSDKETTYLDHLSEQIMSKCNLHPGAFITEVARLIKPAGEKTK